ncbi:MAG: M13 family metallopeptidase [Lautropia sp.]
MRTDSRQPAIGSHAAPIAFSCVFACACVLALAWAPTRVDAALPPMPAETRAQAGPAGYSAANMDRSVDPRRDFYRYAAGAWLDRQTIPPTEGQVGSYTALSQTLDRQLLRLIRAAADDAKADPGENADVGAQGRARRQIGDFYLAATDMARQDALGLEPVAADLHRVAEVEGPAGLGAQSARLQLAYGASPLLNAGVLPDPKRSDVNVLVVVPGAITLGRDEYLEPAGQRVRTLYLEYVRTLFERAGDASEAATTAAQVVLSIETALASTQMTPLQQRDPNATYNLMKPAELQALLPALDVRAFVAALGVSPPDILLVPDVQAVRGLQQVLASRPVAEVRTWLRSHVLTSMASALGERFSTPDRTFRRLRQGLESDVPRERELTRTIKAQFAHPLSQLYVAAHFPESTRRAIAEMIAHVRAEFDARLRTHPWLDEATRAIALDKLAAMDIAVGYPSQWIDYASLSIRRDDHVGNLRRLATFHARRNLERLGLPVVRDRFAVSGATTPVDLNAAYQPKANAIEITAAIVQPPFYVPGADPAVNYCTIGAVIGHEITHGFDSMGRLFDARGNLRDWWTPAAVAAFDARTRVLVEQSSAFEVLPGLMHNGKLTVGENTADLGGISLAHGALHRLLKDKPPLAPIDGLDTDQRCFVAWAQLWMSKQRPEYLRVVVATDPHPVGAYRAFGPLLHLDAFFEAFGIRPGDPMWRAPADRVRIW